MQVYVHRRPVEVLGLWPLDVQDGTHGSVLKPGELLEGQEVLFFVEQQPDPIRSNTDHFSA